MTLTVYRLGCDDWAQLRELRHAALTDSPDAFESTLADEERWDRDRWLHFARDVIWFVGAQNTQPVGMVGACKRPAAHNEVEIISMWVAPPARGHGAADQLLRSALGWAQHIGAESVALWITENNGRARRLYERHEFRLTGERCPLPGGRSGTELRMRRDYRRGRT